MQLHTSAHLNERPRLRRRLQLTRFQLRPTEAPTTVFGALRNSFSAPLHHAGHSSRLAATRQAQAATRLSTRRYSGQPAAQVWLGAGCSLRSYIRQPGTVAESVASACTLAGKCYRFSNAGTVGFCRKNNIKRCGSSGSNSSI
ncbi:hypothetical protein SETIT_5G264200v2 [Setaria italica]|uniref:Uncharacterized protein n=1 Tax=Setaria italica TaxID=4555 RepID=A0A368R8Z1_SETIT|nr:hypothetical protein SETIT_5G264200v2 [Setaria italica]